MIEKVCNNESVDRAELDELFDWLSSDEGSQLFRDEVIRLWNAFSTSDSFDYAQILNEIHRIQSRQEVSRKRRSLRVRRRIAAAVLFPLLMAVTMLLVTSRDDAGDQSEMIVRIHNDVTLTLSDGSDIILDRSTDNCRIAEQGSVTFLRENGKLIQERQEEGVAADEQLRSVTVSVPRGNQFDVELDDGTRVWLNADSRLRYPVVFPGNERRVYLEGEAYFDVGEDGDKRFVVEFAGQELTVTGTEFNVYAYPEEEIALTTLVTGSVTLTSTGSDASVALRPGQQARLASGGGRYTVRNVDVNEITDWRKGDVVFNDIPLEKVFLKLRRWYDFDYEFQDPEVASLTMYGSVPIYDDITSVLELIESSGIATIKQTGNKILVSAKK